MQYRHSQASLKTSSFKERCIYLAGARVQAMVYDGTRLQFMVYAGARLQAMVCG